MRLWCGLQNPAVAHPGRGLFVQTYGGIAIEGSREAVERWEREGVVLVSFDLGKPLQAQLETAERVLRTEIDSEPDRRTHRAKWPVYLRAIDARDAGATYQMIGELVQGGGKEAGHQLWRQAQEVMFKDWP